MKVIPWCKRARYYRRYIDGKKISEWHVSQEQCKRSEKTVHGYPLQTLWMKKS